MPNPLFNGMVCRLDWFGCKVRLPVKLSGFPLRKVFTAPMAHSPQLFVIVTDISLGVFAWSPIVIHETGRSVAIALEMQIVNVKAGMKNFKQLILYLRIEFFLILLDNYIPAISMREFVFLIFSLS